MAECLQGLRIALLAADGVGQFELDASGDAVRHAGAQTQLLSLRSGHIEALDKDLEPVRTYTVDQTVAQATADEYEALLMVPGSITSDRLSSDDLVVSLVRDFITSNKPVGIVCYRAWILLEAGVAQGQSLPMSVTMRAHRKTGASVMRNEPVTSRAVRAFYSTIAEEFARLIRQPAPASADPTEHRSPQAGMRPTRPHREKHSAAEEVARS